MGVFNHNLWERLAAKKLVLESTLLQFQLENNSKDIIKPNLFIEIEAAFLKENIVQLIVVLLIASREK